LRHCSMFACWPACFTLPSLRSVTFARRVLLLYFSLAASLLPSISVFTLRRQFCCAAPSLQIPAIPFSYTYLLHLTYFSYAHLYHSIRCAIVYLTCFRTAILLNQTTLAFFVPLSRIEHGKKIFFFFFFFLPLHALGECRLAFSLCRWRLGRQNDWAW